ncbi:MAG TPA: hypothetical protein VE127_14635, partial [Solirubrobacteraceae bacterium]|nr:hypothetical protein [Solirubrobacteraceae bacterium]
MAVRDSAGEAIGATRAAAEGELHRAAAVPTPRSGIRQLLFPRSVAVVGASPRFAETVSALVAGDVPAWGVHPRH